MGFDLALHKAVISKLNADFPHVAIKALTDDVIPAFAPPEDPSDEASWEKVYDDVASFWHAYDTLANPIGIRRHPDKNQLLLAPDALPPRRHPRAGNIILVEKGTPAELIPPGTNPIFYTRAGVVISGGPNRHRRFRRRTRRNQACQGHADDRCHPGTQEI